jgi:hypothetical protein
MTTVGKKKGRFFLYNHLYYYQNITAYIIIRILGGHTMTEFEQNVQCKRNDAIDAGVGFIVSFGFFAILFIIATIIQFIGS